MIGFGPVPLKREGAIADPDEYTWECNLDECADCRKHYLEWKQKYLEQERQHDPRTTPQHPHPDQRLGVADVGAQSAVSGGAV
jgi:hypothetical protein